MVVAVQTPEILAGAVLIVVLDAFMRIRFGNVSRSSYLRSTAPLAAGLIVVAFLFSLLPRDQAKWVWVVFLVIGVASLLSARRTRDSERRGADSQED